MSIFDDVRQLDLIDVARQYGLAERGNMVNCIFHNDRTPSMKLYHDHFHCFGCGAHGDVTDFTTQLFGLSKYEAAQKLCVDFGITHNAASPKIMPKIKIISQREKENRAINTLIAYSKMLRENAKHYAPKSADEELHPPFVESLQQQSVYEYYLDVLMEASSDERAEFIKINKEVIDYADRRINSSRSDREQPAF